MTSGRQGVTAAPRTPSPLGEEGVGGKARLVELDGVRAVGIMAVLAAHAEILPGGHLGVVVFFVLSGFLITGLLLREYSSNARIDLYAFAVRRTARLLPALIAVVVIATPITFAIRGHAEIVGSVATLLYSANIVAAFWGQEAVGTFSWGWTLSLEEQFYLIWPVSLLWFCVRKRSPIPLLVTLIATSVLFRAVAPLDGVPPAQVYFAPWARWDAIAAGCALAVLLARDVSRFRASWVRPVVGGVGLGVVALCVLESDWVGRPTYAIGVPVVVVASTALIWAVLDGKGPIAWLLRCPPVAYTGRISYGLYLWNIPVAVVVWTLPLSTVPSAVIWIGASFGLAAASYHGLESPMQKRITKYLLGLRDRRRGERRAVPRPRAANGATSDR